MKSIAATHMFVPHSLFFWSYEFVRHEVVRCSECLFWTDQARRFAAVAQHRGEEFAKLLTTADQSVVLWICPLAFLVHHCDPSFFHKLGVMEFCLMIRLRSSCIIVIVFSRAPLTSSALIPLLSADFPFLRLPNAPVSSFLVNSGMCLSCSSFSMSSSRWSQVFSGPASLPCLSLVSSF